MLLYIFPGIAYGVVRGVESRDVVSGVLCLERII